MNHTPGPWHLSRDKRTIFAGTDSAGVLIRGIEQTIPQIAYICGNGFGATLQEQEANARLIAAAPELLEALEDALGLLVKIGERTPIYESDGQIFRAEAAIRKAKGE